MRSSATIPRTGRRRSRAAAAPGAPSSGPSTAPTSAATGFTTTTAQGCGRTPTTTTSVDREQPHREQRKRGGLLRDQLQPGPARQHHPAATAWWLAGNVSPIAATTSRRQPSISRSRGRTTAPARTDRIEIYNNVWRITGRGSPPGRTPTASATVPRTHRPAIARTGSRVRRKNASSQASLTSRCMTTVGGRPSASTSTTTYSCLDPQVVGCANRTSPGSMALLSNYGTFPGLVARTKAP